MKPVFLDIDTQNDFMLPAGALYVPGAERIIAAIAELNLFAMSQGCHLVSTACLHTENDPEFQEWPPHCVAGTMGQMKPLVTLVGQTIFTKQTTNVFQNPRWLPLIQELDASEFVVYGVVTEVCVQFATEGLHRLGKKVTVVTDAIRALQEASAHEFFQAFQANGGKLATAADVTRI